jgi:hypothetical protein
MAEYDSDKKPHEDDLRVDDHEYNPAIEPKSAKAWLNLLLESEDAFEEWHNHCDLIDRQYASLAKLAQMARDKEFQMFWANAEVLKPSIYAKPPVPVVVPKFKDRRPVYQQASEVMERCCNVAFDLARINDLMLLVRDDLSMNSRGVAWCRYESGGSKSDYDHEKVCIDFKGRRDFLHSISRNWREVTWVAAASYLTRSQARERFKKYSDDAYQEAEYKVDKDSKEIGGADNRERAKFWEIWDKGSRRVVWVAEGCEDILDEDDAHLDLQNFFPCPKPAYGTVQRGSLIPVPDVLQYRDQLDEINQLTGRIHALADALQVKGFYPAGGGEAADAIQTALTLNTPGQVMVPISNWASFGQSKEIILWLPIDQIAQTILHLVTLRKQIIEDIYQIMGLSDIMRGATDPNETLGAQQLKTQYGSTRIRDKQQEMVRFARDLVEITSEIITEKFNKVTIIEMSQTQLPTKEMQTKRAQQLERQLQQSMMQMQQIQQQQQVAPPQQPGEEPTATAPPDPSAQIQQQIQGLVVELQKLDQEPTTDQVFKFLKDNRAKSFVLDIETDSTIMADENAEKQRRTEFVGMLATLLPQLSAMMTAAPETAKFCTDILKFSTAPYRAGRVLEGSIDELAELMQQKGQQGQGEDPTTAQHRILLQIEQMKQETIKQKNKADILLKMKEMEQKDQHKQLELENERQIKGAELAAKQNDAQGKAQVQNLKAMENREAHQAHMMENTQKMELDRQKAEVAMRLKQQDHSNKAAAAQMAAQAKQQNGGLV